MPNASEDKGFFVVKTTTLTAQTERSTYNHIISIIQHLYHTIMHRISFTGKNEQQIQYLYLLLRGHLKILSIGTRSPTPRA